MVYLRERENGHAHARETTHKLREYQEVALALPPQEESTTAPWVPELG